MRTFVKRTPGQIEACRQIIAALRVLGIAVDGRKLPAVDQLYEAERRLYGAQMDHLTNPERWRAIIVASRMHKTEPGKYAAQHATLGSSPTQWLNSARRLLKEANKFMADGDYIKGKLLLSHARYAQDQSKIAAGQLECVRCA